MRIEALYLHPIKSCAGIAVGRARVTRRGLEHDRRWMVADGEGHFVSQRTLPAMHAIRLALVDGGAALLVTREGLPPLTLPALASAGARVACDVFEERTWGLRHDGGSEWFTRALGRPLQLVCMPDEAERPVDPDWARAGDLVSFADGFPLLLVNRASLADLNTRSNVGIDVRRFRPNVVIAGAAAWAEDQWRALGIGGLSFRTPKPCARCTVPGVDPDSGETTKEPLRTLAALRKQGTAVYFGVNAIPDAEGELAVGDEVRVEVSA